MKNPILLPAVLSALLMAAAAATQAAGEPPLLLQSPTLSASQIAFTYGDDIWIVGRDGGDAHRLVAGGGFNTGPIFSPDGSMIAYTSRLDENTDVYVVPSAGGEPRRLTYHPASDVAVGWTRDGRRILFRSNRDNYAGFDRLFTVPIEGGGLPEALPLPTGEEGSYSADSSHIAYVPVWNRRGGDSYIAIQHYRGGKAALIWVADLADSSITPIPRTDSNDFDPMWIGDKIYFLSDRNGTVTLFNYDVNTHQVRELVKNDGFDLKSASAGPAGQIIYEQLGSLHLYDTATGQSRTVTVHVRGDMPQTRPHWEKVDGEIAATDISPSGARAVFEAHGDIFTVPAEKGDVRNVTNSPAVFDRNPSWSPDGKSIAYFSDATGEYALYIMDQAGHGPARKIDLGLPPSFFNDPLWSPDGHKIAYYDKRMILWYVDLDHPQPVKVDTDRFQNSSFEFSPAWSGDSRWLTYMKQLDNHFHAIMVYSLDTGKATQLTDGMSDARSPQFDRNGKELYFTASTDLGLGESSVDMTGIGHQATRSIYAMVLRKDTPSPLAPESDEEKGGAAAPAADDKAKDAKDADKTEEDKPKDQAAAEIKGADEANLPVLHAQGHAAARGKKGPPKVDIDFDAIDQRIIALPIPAGRIGRLVAGKEGVLYIVSSGGDGDADGGGRAGGGEEVRRFDFKTRKADRILTGAGGFVLSANCEKMLYSQRGKYFIAAADKAPKPGDGQLKLDGMEILVDPMAEWRQMYHDYWRIERDFFYNPHFNGLDLAQAEKVYAPFLPGIASRSDLNYLFADMMGQLNVLHMFVGGGTHPHEDRVSVGLLGADYEIDSGHYRFKKVYSGENWDPGLKAPLTQPGVNVKAGEYLFAVNGRELSATDEIYSFFQETAGRQVVLKVGPNPDRSGSRNVTVIPIPSDGPLRHLSWIDDNRRKVDELSGGQLAYVYMPDTAVNGVDAFNRYYFAGVGRRGVVVDDRFNAGGKLADYVIDFLNRPVMSRIATREGEDYSEPLAAIQGPDVMIINQYAGSGGDAMPWLFRKAGLGKLVGMRTWGGLVGIGGAPSLLDGAAVTSPHSAIYGLNGQWEVENHGVAPDIEVDLDPKLIREGHDPQLERAVAILMDQLKDTPVKTYQRPPYPDYHPHLPATP